MAFSTCAMSARSTNVRKRNSCQLHYPASRKNTCTGSKGESAWHRARCYLFRLAKLATIGHGDQGHGHPLHVGLARLSLDKIQSRRDVAPLVTSANLQIASKGLVQVEVVVCLEKHVTEFGIADSLIAIFKPGPHRFLRHHHVDGKELADIAQKFNDFHRTKPVGIVDQQKILPTFPSKSVSNCLPIPATLWAMASLSSRLRSADFHSDRRSCRSLRQPGQSAWHRSP